MYSTHRELFKKNKRMCWTDRELFKEKKNFWTDQESFKEKKRMFWTNREWWKGPLTLSISFSFSPTLCFLSSENEWFLRKKEIYGKSAQILFHDFWHGTLLPRSVKMLFYKRSHEPEPVTHCHHWSTTINFEVLSHQICESWQVLASQKQLFKSDYLQLRSTRRYLPIKSWQLHLCSVFNWLINWRYDPASLNPETVRTIQKLINSAISSHPIMAGAPVSGFQLMFYRKLCYKLNLWSSISAAHCTMQLSHVNVLIRDSSQIWQ